MENVPVIAVQLSLAPAAPATNKGHNLHFAGVSHQRGADLHAFDDFSVEFYRHRPAVQPQLVEQGGHRKRSHDRVALRQVVCDGTCPLIVHHN